MEGYAGGLLTSLAAQSPVLGTLVISLSLSMTDSICRVAAHPCWGGSIAQCLFAVPEVVLCFSCSAFSLVPADKHCEWTTAKNCIHCGAKAFWKLAFAKIETATLTLTLALGFLKHHMVAQKT